MQNEWAYWWAARKGMFGNITEANPQTGYYRHYSGAPVAIWRLNGAIVMLVDDAAVEDPVRQGRTWLECAKHPVSKEDYDARIKSEEWPSNLPDIPPPASVKTVEPAETETETGPGHNSGDLDSYALMCDQIMGDVAAARAFYIKNKITEKAEADRAIDWALRLRNSAADADKKRLAETKPLRDQIDAINARWNSVIDAAKTQSTALDTAAREWGKAETERLRRIAQEEAEKAWREQQEAARIERERLAAERAARAAQEPTAAPEPEPELPMAPPPPPVVEAPRLMLGTGTQGKRRAAVDKPAETATITDLKAAAIALAEINHPDLVALVQKIADRSIKARRPMPGIAFSWQTAAEKVA